MWKCPTTMGASVLVSWAEAGRSAAATRTAARTVRPTLVRVCMARIVLLRDTPARRSERLETDHVEDVGEVVGPERDAVAHRRRGRAAADHRLQVVGGPRRHDPRRRR